MVPQADDVIAPQGVDLKLGAFISFRDQAENSINGFVATGPFIDPDAIANTCNQWGPVVYKKIGGVLPE